MGNFEASCPRFICTQKPVPPVADTHKSTLLLSLACFCSMVAQRICDPMLPELARVFSVSLREATQVVSLFALSYGAALFVHGPVGDRLGKFRIVTWATLACGACSLLAVFAADMSLLVLSRMLMGAAAAAIVPLTLAWIGDTVPGAQVQETLAKVAVGTTLGAATGQLMGGLLTQSLGWRWAFGFLALLFSLVGAYLLLDWRRQQARAAPATDHDRRPDGGLAGASLFSKTVPILRHAWPRAVLLIAFAEGAAGMGALALWAAHLQSAMGLAASSAGAVVALLGAGSLLYLFAARPLIARLGQQTLALVGGSLMGVSALVFAYAQTWQLAALASVLAGLGFAMFHNTMQANAAQMAPAARGAAVALFASALFLGQAVGAAVASSAFARFGSSQVVAGAGVVMILLGWLLAAGLRRRQRTVLGA